MSTGWTQPALGFPGTFPYGHTSGYAAGSPTSEDRARTEDAAGTTTERQRRVLVILSAAGTAGATWTDLATLTGWHHGQASGALSTLHKSGLIARLDERRNRCAVYVLPEHVADRGTQPHGSTTHAPARLVLSAEAVTDALAEAGLTGREAARARNALRSLGLELTR